MVSRRDLLKATLTGAGVGAFPVSIQKALAIPANNKTGTIKDVEHVVILMQENRSFDHYFGTYKGVRGFADRFTIPLPEGKTVWEQTNWKGKVVAPYHLDQSKGNAQRTRMTPHSWVDAQNAWDKGRMTNWPEHKYDQSMGYYTRNELPFQFALAEAFTLCDAYHCSLHGGTNTNRMFHWTGTNGASIGKPITVNNRYDSLGPSGLGYDWKTYPERLEEAGISWMVYQNLPDNFTDNPLAGFKQYRRENEATQKPKNAPYDASLNAKHPLYKGISNTMPDGGFLGTFKKAVKNNELPQVSWIIAPEAYSEHPGPSSPVQGAWYMQEVLDALTANPDVWSKTVFLVNFDENDGFFDHVPPPCVPSVEWFAERGKTTLSAIENQKERYLGMSEFGMPIPNNGSFGPGPRVPMFVISPWSRGGWVNSETFDHTSVLRFLEARFGVQEPNISQYRRAVCGDLTSAFNFKTPNHTPVDLTDAKTTKENADKLRAEQQRQSWVSVPNKPTLPKQEVGVRLSRALPYELHTSMRTRADSQKVQLLFANTGKVGAVFHVYNKKNLKDVPKRYMVEASKTLKDEWYVGGRDGGHYDLWILSSNGFHRHFMGNVKLLLNGKESPEIRVCYEPCTQKIYLDLKNPLGKKVTFIVKDEAYFAKKEWSVTLEPNTEFTLDWSLKDSHQWYDFSVRSDFDGTWYRRFAGRMETGEDGVTDPAMGLSV